MSATSHPTTTSTPVPALAAILEHPTRRRCWSLLAERTMSPKELAEELGLNLSHVAYHVRALQKTGVIELVRTEPRRGATGHWYRCVERPDMRHPEVEALTPEESTQNVGHIVQLQVADIASSLESGKLIERRNHSVVRFPADLDEEGWHELATFMDGALDKVYEVQEASIERTERNPEARSVSAMVHLNLFEMPPREDRAKQF